MWRLHYGLALQRLGRPVSARRVYEDAAKRYPGDVEALVAAAVGRFAKERPEAAFSRLGPLSRRFPDAATVRFHLGLLLLWSSQVEEAERQLRLAARAEPGSRLAEQARRYLEELKKMGPADAKMGRTAHGAQPRRMAGFPIFCLRTVAESRGRIYCESSSRRGNRDGRRGCNRREHEGCAPRVRGAGDGRGEAAT